jgi:hypothetical protein
MEREAKQNKCRAGRLVGSKPPYTEGANHTRSISGKPDAEHAIIIPCRALIRKVYGGGRFDVPFRIEHRSCLFVVARKT